MISQPELPDIIKPLCTGVDEEVVRDFLSRMDPDYFTHTDPADVARHIALINRLTPDQPGQIKIAPGPEGAYELTVVAYDYFSEFAAICGLLSAFGLDIREGSIYTYSDDDVASAPRPNTRPLDRPASRRRTTRERVPGLARKKIVDRFVVKPFAPLPWTDPEQSRFTHELIELLRLLEQSQFQEARRRIHRHLIERLAGMRGDGGLLNPVHIRFDNELSPRDTVMDIRSGDTPAFLYAFSNALSMRGVYISKARLENLGAELHDRVYIRDRHGRKITDSAVLHELRITAVLMKQYTHYLTWAPDPAKAMEHFDQFLDQILETCAHAPGRKVLSFLTKKETLVSLARLLGSSDFLWEDFLRRQHVNVLPLLETYQRLPLTRPKAQLSKELRKKLTRAKTEEQRRRSINAFKDQEMFRIDMKHLADADAPLDQFSQALTDLAEVVLEETLRACMTKLSRRHGTPRANDGARCPFTVLGLGKFGGRELGYASDIEVLFVYGAPGNTSGKSPIDNSEFFERLVQEMLQWIEAKQEGIFHIDIRLRPHGSKGQLANTLGELQRYYGAGGLSAPFERQALIKLRAVAGDAALGARVEQLRDSAVYSADPWNIAEAFELRAAQIKELVDPDRINVKYSPGGLIDVEYAVQYLQLIHGHVHPELRTPNTLEALAALEHLVLLSSTDVATLREAYLFFRLIIDGLRIVRGHAKDLVLPPAGSDAFVFLARRVGYASADWQEGAAKLDADLHRHMAKTSAFVDSHFRA